MPLQAREELWNPAPQDPAYRSSITLLAIDQLGEALIKQYSLDDSRYAEGWSYSVMPIDRATQLLRTHGAAADLNLDVAKSFGSGENSMRPTAIGGPHRGPVLAIKGDTVYQLVDKETTIQHWVGAMAITNPQQYVGKEVEISYPCGKVGLLREVDALAHEAPALQKSGAEKNASSLER